MNARIFRRDQIGADVDLIRQRQALDYSIGELQRACSGIQAAKCGDASSMRDAVLASVHSRIESMLRELRSLT